MRLSESRPLTKQPALQKMRLFARTIYGHQREVGQFQDGLAVFLVYQEHFFQKARAWGIDEDVFHRLEELNCQRITLKIQDTGEQFTADFKDFVLHSWSHQFIKFAPKRFLALERWQRIPPKSREEEEKEILMSALI